MVVTSAQAVARHGSVLAPHRRLSRQTITASPPTTTHAMPLSHTGTTVPLTVTSHLKTKRSSCRSAISARTMTTMVVNGFGSSRFPGVIVVPATYARPQSVSIAVHSLTPVLRAVPRDASSVPRPELPRHGSLQVVGMPSGQMFRGSSEIALPHVAAFLGRPCLYFSASHPGLADIFRAPLPNIVSPSQRRDLLSSVTATGRAWATTWALGVLLALAGC